MKGLIYDVIQDITDYNELRKTYQEQYGFVTYEAMPGDQQVWYGPSATADDFVEITTPAEGWEDIFPRGTQNPFSAGDIMYIVDTGKKYIYYDNEIWAKDESKKAARLSLAGWYALDGTGKYVPSNA